MATNPEGNPRPSTGMGRLIAELLRPYRRWLAIILLATIQNFASEATLGIIVDLLSIAGMLGLMFWLNWDFALITVGVAPFLLLFVMRFRKAVKKATREVRRRESDLFGVVQQGLESIRVVNAFGRQDLEEEHLQEASRAAVQAALKARRVKSLLSPVVTVTVP